MLERDIQNQILLAVGSRKDVRLWHQNAGMARSIETDNVIRMGVAGCADLTGIVTIAGLGVRLEIEVKTQKGRQSDQQIRFEKMVKDRGGIYILARSVADAISSLEEAINEIGHKLSDNR